MEFNDIDPIGREEEPRLRRPFRNPPPAPRHIHSSQHFHRCESSLWVLRDSGDARGGRSQTSINAAARSGSRYLFDSLDGRIARAMGTNSEFGKEFDSLADVVSFGMAPAIACVRWGVRCDGGSESRPKPFT